MGAFFLYWIPERNSCLFFSFVVYVFFKAPIEAWGPSFCDWLCENTNTEFILIVIVCVVSWFWHWLKEAPLLNRVVYLTTKICIMKWTTAAQWSRTTVQYILCNATASPRRRLQERPCAIVIGMASNEQQWDITSRSKQQIRQNKRRERAQRMLMQVILCFALCFKWKFKQ